MGSKPYHVLAIRYCLCSIGYACEMNFRSLARRNFWFSRQSLVGKWIKVHFLNDLRADQNSIQTRDVDNLESGSKFISHTYPVRDNAFFTYPLLDQSSYSYMFILCIHYYKTCFPVYCGTARYRPPRKDQKSF